MRKPVFAALLLILALSGCAGTTKIDKQQTAGQYYMSINEKCENKYAVLRLQNKELFRVYNINVGIDSTTWKDVSSGNVKSVRTDSVYSVQVTNRAEGVLSGLALGVLGGAAAGFAYGKMTDPMGLNGGSYLGLLGGAVVGAVAGTILGVTIGGQSYFIINEKTK